MQKQTWPNEWMCIRVLWKAMVQSGVAAERMAPVGGSHTKRANGNSLGDKGTNLLPTLIDRRQAGNESILSAFADLQTLHCIGGQMVRSCCKTEFKSWFQI